MSSFANLADNPIAIGYAWACPLDFPAGFLQAGDEVRADFRSLPEAETAFVADAVRDGTRVTLALTAEQTATMKHGARYYADLILVTQADGEVPANARLAVVARMLTTRSAENG